MTEMKYENIFFDLDGTLIDSGEGIMNSVQYALKKFGIEERDRERLRLFIGPPLIDSFMRYYGFDHDMAVKGVEYYREYFAPKGIYENRPYDGIPEMMQALKDEGKKLYLATSKPEPYATEIVRHFGLLGFSRRSLRKYDDRGENKKGRGHRLRPREHGDR